MRKGTRKILGLGALLLLAMPPVIFFGTAFSAGLDLASAFEALSEQYSAPRQNLLVLSTISLIPWALQAVVLLVIRRFSKDHEALPWLALSGLLPIIFIVGWIHLDFW